MLAFSFKAFPLDSLLLVLVNLLFALFYLGNLYGIQLFFDTLQGALKGGLWESTLPLLMGLGLILTLYNLSNGGANFLGYYLPQKVYARMSKVLLQRVNRLPLEDFEHPELFDKIRLGQEGLDYALGSSGELLAVLFLYLPLFTLCGLYFYSLKPLLVLLLFVSFVPQLLASSLKGRLESALLDENSPLKRQMEAYENYIKDRSFFKETRILGLRDYFLKGYQERAEAYGRKRKKLLLKTQLMDLTVGFFGFLGYSASFLLLFYYLINSQITLGGFATVYYSLQSLMGLMEELIGTSGRTITLGRLGNKMFRLLKEEPEERPRRGSSLSRISLEGISYTYPHRDKPSIEGLSLEIQEGESLAIVGPNGAGKTTLAKILLGLLEPQKGIVRQGEGRVSGIFQDFVRYKLSYRENVVIGDGENQGEEHYRSALKVSGSPDLPGETLLCKEFGGRDLSGGEWQRVALARGIYRRHDFLVLDEPTAAIDPLEELALFEKFIKISAGKTTVIITHRMLAASLASRIIVLQGGRLLEAGTHRELMERGGLYHIMYSTQAKNYEEKPL